MEYESLHQKLDVIFSCLCLTDEEKQVMMSSYLSPGINQRDILNQSVGSLNVLHDLVNKGLILKRESGKNFQLFPVPIALLIQYCEKNIDCECLKKVRESISSIDKWIKYPLMRSKNTVLKTSDENSTVLKWLFDLHSIEWDKVYCFGDYESFIDSIGIDAETNWIKERTKKGRKASVVATKDGKWARRIRDFSQQELRDCLIEPKDFSELFIIAFPDIHTTVIGSSDKEVTFVHSSAIAQHYSKLVEENLIEA